MKPDKNIEKININEEFFIQVLSDYLNGRKTSYKEGIDWKEILRLATIHKVDGIVFLQVRSLLPKEIQLEYAVKAVTQFKDSQKKIETVEEIEKAFTENHIDFFVVKGVEVARYYSSIKDRSMGDIDIVVKTEDRPRSAEVLEAMGYKNKTVGFYDWQYDLEDVHIELHNHLQYENVTTSERYEYLEKMWDHALRKEETSRLMLDWNFHLVFLIMHLEKHFENGGVGFRLFIDLVRICQNVEIDYLKLKRDLENLDLLRFASICFGFCERWFDVKMPFSIDLSDEFYTASTIKIINNGVFGSAEQEMDNYIQARMNEKGRLGAFINRYFPPYKFMVEDPRFTYLKTYPILLPYTWIVRAVCAVFDGYLKEEAQRFTRFFKSDKEIDERKKLLSEWGVENKTLTISKKTYNVGKEKHQR